MKRALMAAGAVILAAMAFVTGTLSAPRPSIPPAAGAQGVWTCSMHPQVRLPAPGTCPICGMPLVPASAGEGGDAGSVLLGERALAMAGVETQEVRRRALAKEIRAVGRVSPNEAAVTTVASRVSGYIERLYVDTTGVRVETDDHLVDIYSPELVTAGQEFLVALDSKASPALVEAVERKLRRLGLTAEQVEALRTKRTAGDRVTIHSPRAGTVIEKAVVEGSAVSAGDTLYRLADLGTVWVHLEIYEFEIGWVQPGEPVACTAEAWPGHEFRGTVTFVSPVLDEATRTVRVRVALPNRDGRLKPGMFVSASLRVALRADGRAAPTPAAGRWSCPMHPEVLEEVAGKCRACGMDLAQDPPGEPEGPGDLEVLAVPAEAVLELGTRRLVYVETSRGRFRPAVVELGPRAGDWYPVVQGLHEGDRVARRGAFLLDSEAQIRGLESLLRDGGGAHEGSDHR